MTKLRTLWVALILIVSMLALIFLFQTSVFTKILESGFNLNKYYISKKYSIDIINHTQANKSHSYWGIERKSGKLKYVLDVYRMGLYEVDGDSGITYADVKNKSESVSKTTLNICLIVKDTFDKEENILDYMYWFVEYSDSSVKYFSFTDGQEVFPFMDQ